MMYTEKVISFFKLLSNWHSRAHETVFLARLIQICSARPAIIFFFLKKKKRNLLNIKYPLHFYNLSPHLAQQHAYVYVRRLFDSVWKNV